VAARMAGAVGEDPERRGMGSLSDPVRDHLLGQWDQLEPGTLASVGRVPQSLWEYRPHERSTPMGRLAGHVATLPFMLQVILTTDGFDLAKGGRERPPMPQTAAELEPTAARLFAEGRKLLARTDDAHLAVVWPFLMNGSPIAPPASRAAQIQHLCLGHLIHHRAQLGVYLRLNNLDVPALFGPSADEGLPGT
jgi:uncharacterized damage-inducible protein DinB